MPLPASEIGSSSRGLPRLSRVADGGGVENWRFMGLEEGNVVEPGLWGEVGGGNM